MGHQTLLRLRRPITRMILASAIALTPLLGGVPLWLSHASDAQRLVPGKPFQMSVTTNRIELLAAADRATRDNQSYLAQLDARGKEAVAEAQEIRSHIASLRNTAAMIAPGGIETNISMVPLLRQTSGSALGPLPAQAGGINGFSVYTYWGPNTISGIAGYVQNMFANYPGTPSQSGSSSSVNSALINATANPRWWDGGGATEYVYNCVDGNCVWISPSYNVQIYDDPCLNPYVITQANPPMVCPGPSPAQDQYPRKHSRLYESQSVTAAGDLWTLGDSHHDNMGHTCVDDWDNARDVLMQSMPPGHVIVSAYSNSGNAASTPTYNSTPPECSTHDGLMANAWLV
jgi:hypothetical protein